MGRRSRLHLRRGAARREVGRIAHVVQHGARARRRSRAQRQGARPSPQRRRSRALRDVERRPEVDEAVARPIRLRRRQEQQHRLRRAQPLRHLRCAREGSGEALQDARRRKARQLRRGVFSRWAEVDELSEESGAAVQRHDHVHAASADRRVHGVSQAAGDRARVSAARRVAVDQCRHAGLERARAGVWSRRDRRSVGDEQGGAHRGLQHVGVPARERIPGIADDLQGDSATGAIAGGAGAESAGWPDRRRTRDQHRRHEVGAHVAADDRHPARRARHVRWRRDSRRRLESRPHEG